MEVTFSTGLTEFSYYVSELLSTLDMCSVLKGKDSLNLDSLTLALTWKVEKTLVCGSYPNSVLRDIIH